MEEFDKAMAAASDNKDYDESHMSGPLNGAVLPNVLATGASKK